jgi:cytochrome P450
MTHTSEAPALPTTRPAGCPFDPPAEFAGLRESAPVTRVRTPAGFDAWLVTRHDDVRALLADPAVSSRGASSLHVKPDLDPDEPTRPGALIQLDGAAHSRVRKTVLAEFTVRRVETLRGYVREQVERHLDAMLAQPGEADLVADFAMPIPSLTICELLGVPYADRESFQRQSQTLVSTGLAPGESDLAFRELSEYLGQLFSGKQQDPSDDLFSKMILRGRQTGDQLSLDELIMLGLNLLVAGHETTANMIALGALLLLDQPARRAEALAAPQRAIEELLRYLSVVQFGVLRYATEDVKIGDQLVPAGDWVIGALSSANRDGDRYPDADRLDFARESPRTHVAFGFGAHQCIGQQLARVEMQEALTALFRRVPDLRLAVPKESLAYKHDTLVYGLESMPVAWTA